MPAIKELHTSMHSLGQVVDEDTKAITAASGQLEHRVNHGGQAATLELGQHAEADQKLSTETQNLDG